MDIVQYIKEQLFTSQEVLLSGFGKFIGERRAAYIEKEKVHPPSKVITFVRDTKSVSTDLAIYIAKKERISEEDAIKAIDEFVGTSNKKLSSGNTVVFEGIGIITSLEGGKVGFKQSHQSNLLPETYGMEAVPLANLNKKATGTAATSKKESFIWMWILLSVAAISLIVVAGWWFYIRKDNDKQIATHTTISKETTIINNETTVTITNKEDSLVSTDSKESSEVSQPVKESTPVKLNTSDSSSVENTFQTHLQNKQFIYLIVGSFKEKRYATDLQKNMKNEGYESEILDTETGFYRVTIGKFPNADEATKILNTYTDAKPENEVWAL